MTEKLTIVIDSADASLSGLDAGEAFGQLRDLFQLANAGQPEGGAMYWRLVQVSMNSPLTVVAEATPIDLSTDVDVDALARENKVQFQSNLTALRHGEMPEAWAESELRSAASRVLERAAASSISETTITLLVGDTRADSVIFSIIGDDASVALRQLGAPANEALKFTKEQFGSIEGVMVSVGLHRRKPAIQLIERKRAQKVWCMVSDSHVQEFANTSTFEDVWRGRRVLVSGRISYDRLGRPVRIEADRIRRISGSEVDVAGIRDPKFTSGLSIADYIEQLREGALG